RMSRSKVNSPSAGASWANATVRLQVIADNKQAVVIQRRIFMANHFCANRGRQQAGEVGLRLPSLTRIAVPLKTRRSILQRFGCARGARCRLDQPTAKGVWDPRRGCSGGIAGT